MLTEQNCWTVVAETKNVVRWVKNALMLASPANGDERHFGIDQLAERAPEIAIMVARHPHVTASGPATLDGL